MYVLSVNWPVRYSSKGLENLKTYNCAIFVIISDIKGFDWCLILLGRFLRVNFCYINLQSIDTEVYIVLY